jgi:hypothetical protein
MPLQQDYAVGDSSKFKRKAAFTSNETNALVSSSPRWSDYPRRDQAWICSSFEQTAWQYGKAFLVIPSDNAHMGICPDGDFWYSFREGLRGTGFPDIGDLNQFFGWVRLLSNHKYKLDPDNIDQFRNELSEITADMLREMVGTLQDYEADTIRAVIVNMRGKKDSDLQAFFERIFDPTLNKFLHTDASDYGGVNEAREIWIRGECVFIRIESDRMGSHTHKLINQLKEELYAV